jgi:hypothetical protein
VVLVFWVCIIFVSFGLFAPRNATVIAFLCVCALSVSGAIFLLGRLASAVLSVELGATNGAPAQPG